jgi:hypothetical protein
MVRMADWRTLTAIAADERRSRPSLTVTRSSSLPRLPTLPSRAALPTPTAARERINLALPQLSQSQSLGSLTGQANARQRRVQLELDQALKKQPGQLASEASSMNLLSTLGRPSKVRTAAFGEMYEDIERIVDEAATIREGASLKQAAALSGETEEQAEARREEEAERKREEQRRRRAAELAEKVATVGRKGSKVRVEIEAKLDELREDEDARRAFDLYCQTIKPQRNTDIVRRSPRHAAPALRTRHARVHAAHSPAAELRPPPRRRRRATLPPTPPPGVLSCADRPTHRVLERMRAGGVVGAAARAGGGTAAAAR